MHAVVGIEYNTVTVQLCSVSKPNYTVSELYIIATSVDL